MAGITCVANSVQEAAEVLRIGRNYCLLNLFRVSAGYIYTKQMVYMLTGKPNRKSMVIPWEA